MSDLKAIAAAAARYSSENIELRAKLQEIERRIDSILKSDYPGEDLFQLRSYVKNAKEAPKQPIDWTGRLESDMEGIYWIIRRDMDAILPRRAQTDIQNTLQKLIQDVETKTREDERRGDNR